MTPNAFNLLLAALAMVVLTFAVGLRMLYSRVQEMRRSVCIRKRRPLQRRWLPTWRTFRQRITTAICLRHRFCSMRWWRAQSPRRMRRPGS